MLRDLRRNVPGINAAEEELIEAAFSMAQDAHQAARNRRLGRAEKEATIIVAASRQAQASRLFRAIQDRARDRVQS